jgi:hypothetical protein
MKTPKPVLKSIAGSLALLHEFVARLDSRMGRLENAVLEANNLAREAVSRMQPKVTIIDKPMMADDCLFEPGAQIQHVLQACAAELKRRTPSKVAPRKPAKKARTSTPRAKS